MSSIPTTLEELAKQVTIVDPISVERMRSILFNCVDFLMENVPQEAVDAGMYHMPANVGDETMRKAYKEVLWAAYEQATEGKVSFDEPWVGIDPNQGTLSIHRQRPY